MRNHSNENDFNLHENGREGGTHVHMNGFARRLVLKQRQRVTRKWFKRLYALTNHCQLDNKYGVNMSDAFVWASMLAFIC